MTERLLALLKCTPYGMRRHWRRHWRRSKHMYVYNKYILYIPTIIILFRSGRRRRWGRGCRTQHQIRGSGNQIQGPAAAQQELRGGKGERVTRPRAVLWIRIHMDPHHFGNLVDPYPDPHQIKTRIRIHIWIRIKVINWIRNRIRSASICR